VTAPLCLWCEEPVLPDERQEPTTVIGDRVWHTVERRWVLIGQPAVRHYECAARTVVGSVGHQLGLCTCHGTGRMGDPPMLTKRQAACAALAVCNLLCVLAERSTR
jgi:hypothetical protein